MLPSIRAVLGAIVAAVALLAMSFALMAAFRVAQDTRTGMLQADLAQRGRSSIPASQESRPALLADKPTPLEANPVAAVEVQEAPEIPKDAPATPMAAVLAVPQGEPPVAELPATDVVAVKPPSAEPPMGGPLVEDTLTQSGQPAPRAVDEIAAKKAKKKKKAEQAAAKKARAQRLARERKAAARKVRAAQARAKQQSASSFDNAPPGNSFGIFNNGNSPLPNGTFGNGTFGTSASGQ
ncbi:MAG: hypothetical protein QOF14_2584 [Hyphomicrobiales bacterium]|jgi:hypothetical protein|nr:hypothetical protein [Hyphomicrobiales bacterium]